MEQSLFKYIWRHSRAEQLSVLLLVAISLPFYYYSLNLPKTIVNGPIQGEGFLDPQTGEAISGASARFLQISLPDFLGGAELFGGFEMGRTAYLFALSLLFLLFVFINGGFKFVINMRKGRMGERMLRRLRFELIDRVLRFPPAHFKRVKTAEVASMVKDEVEPLGGFIGDAFVLPAFQAGLALTALGFIIAQDFWLGLVAAGVVGVQSFLIPILRKPILKLGKQRQLTARQLAGRVGEIVDGVNEVRVHDASTWERAELTSRLGRIFAIRYEIFQRKFFVKFLNNFLAQLTPFLFYAIGGWLVIQGSLSVGALVAVIAAYKDLPAPVKELINWDQIRQDVQIKYEQVIEQFAPEGMLDPALQDPTVDASAPLKGEVVVQGLTVADDSDVKQLDGVSFAAPLASRVAVVGAPGSGREYLGYALGRLVTPSGGSARIGGLNLEDAPEAVTGRRVSYVGAEAYFFPASIRENLLYGLKHLPLKPAEDDPRDEATRAFDVAEAARTANSPYSIHDDWVDYAAAGAAGPEDIDERLLAALQTAGLAQDIYQFGLNGGVDADADPDLADKILAARAEMRARLGEDGLAGLVEQFDPDAYNRNATVAENLMFGAAVGTAFQPDRIAENSHICEVLRQASLEDRFIAMGREIAEVMVELLADARPGDSFLEQYSFIAIEDLPDFQAILTRAARAGLEGLSEEDRARLRGLPFGYIEARHRLDLIDDSLAADIVAARARFADGLPDDLKAAVAVYDPDAYSSGASIQDNVLFGRVAYGQAEGPARIAEAVHDVLDGLGLKPAIYRIGLAFDVGGGGRRLSSAQRQRLSIARAIVKRPDYLIVNEALAPLDPASQGRLIEEVTAFREGAGALWVLSRARLAQGFDEVIVLADGRVAERGAPEELAEDGAFGRLVEAEG